MACEHVGKNLNLGAQHSCHCCTTSYKSCIFLKSECLPLQAVSNPA